jgi:DtxR family Mn-dependent transcriptional regulator
MLTRNAEDYLETIYLIVKQKGYARPKDIVAMMNVKHPSATEMIKKLSTQNLVNYEKYGEVTLTPEGEEIAKKIRRRHEIFERFLRIISVPSEIAQKDACILEHNLDSGTVKQLSKFVSFVEGHDAKPLFIERFEKYCKTGMISNKVKKSKK